jgi:hypothetical protein
MMVCMVDLQHSSKGPLFRTIGRTTGQLTRTPLPQQNAHLNLMRRASSLVLLSQKVAVSAPVESVFMEIHISLGG